MIQTLARRIKHLALIAFALALPVFGSDSALAPIAKLYEGDVFIGDVIKLGPMLGSGRFGTVQKVVIRYLNGEEQTVALKILDSQDNTERMQQITNSWNLLKPVYAQDHEKVLNNGTAGLKLVSINEKDKSKGLHVISSTLAKGSISSKQESLVLNPQEAAYEAKIGVLAKLHQQMLSGITLLTSHGLTHGDIKPDNILYTTKPGFDWNHPDSKKIHFALTDFDSITPFGHPIRRFTRATAPPEIFTRLFLPPKLLARAKFNAMPEWDIYSESASIYSMIFGSKPLEDYLTSLRNKGQRRSGIDEERLKAYSDPKLYDEILHHVDSRFKALESQTASPHSRKTLQDLHASVLSGLAFSPEDRLMAFPKIRNSAQSYLDAAAHGKTPHCDNLVPYLRARLH